LNSRATTPKKKEEKKHTVEKAQNGRTRRQAQDNMPGESTVQETREEGDICPTCNRGVEENETAVACDMPEMALSLM
jgi:DNA repair exonuclease SbcCD ATPase subunit